MLPRPSLPTHAPHPAPGHASHTGHPDHVAQFRRLFWISLALSVPVVLLDRMFAQLLRYEVPAVPGVALVPPVLGTVIFVYGGMPFLTRGLRELRSRPAGMMPLVALAL